MVQAVEVVPGLSLKDRVAIDGDLETLVSLSEELEGGEKVREAVEACLSPASGILDH